MSYSKQSVIVLGVLHDNRRRALFRQQIFDLAPKEEFSISRIDSYTSDLEDDELITVNESSGSSRPTYQITAKGIKVWKTLKPEGWKLAKPESAKKKVRPKKASKPEPTKPLPQTPAPTDKRLNIQIVDE